MNLLLRQHKTPIRKIFTDADRAVFKQEMIDLFDRTRQGHLIHRCYLTQDALRFGGKFSTAPANYSAREELSAILNATLPISDRAQNPDGIIGIENGPGMESAMRTKSTMFFSGLHGLHTWVGRDLSGDSTALMPSIMSEVLKGKRIVPDQANFITDSLPNGLGLGRKVMAEFGLTIGNMEGFPKDGFPYERMLSALKARLSHLDNGDMMTFTFDCNQNGQEVEDAYNSDWTTLWARELLRVAKYELDIEGDFDPDDFVFRDEWVGESHGGFNYVIATRPLDFAIGDKNFKVDTGDKWGITNSYKMPYEMTEQLANDLNTDLIVYRSNGNRIALPCFIK
jgi:hypothetical protein